MSLSLNTGVAFRLYGSVVLFALRGDDMRYVAFVVLALALMGCASTAMHRSSIAPSASASSDAAPPSSVQATCSGSAAVLTARMKAAGLPIKDLIVYDATTDPNHLLGRQG